MVPADNAPLGAAGPPLDTAIYPYPWVATLCQLCNSWFSKAIDLRNHHDSQHRATPLQYRCSKCQHLFDRWHGVACHYSRCHPQPETADDLPAPRPDWTCACGRGFGTQAGLTLHRNRCQPDARNNERLAPPPSPPVLRASSLWSAEEDTVLIQRYWEFRRDGRLQGYAPYVALGLPEKSERQVRDRVRTLRDAGLLVRPDPIAAAIEPEPPAPDEDNQGQPEPDTPPTVADVDERVATMDNPDDIDATSSRSISPERSLLPIPDMTPVHEDQRVDQQPIDSPRVPTATPLSPIPEPQAPLEGEPDDWARVLRHIEAIQPLCPLGVRLRQLAATEGDIQIELDILVDNLHQALRDMAPEEGRRQPTHRGNRPARSERTRHNVTRYAKTQDLWKKAPSRLASMVIDNNLGDLDREERRCDPPREATIEHFQNLWGTACGTTLELTHPAPRSDAGVDPISCREVTTRIRRLKPNGAPGPDGVTKRCLTSYPHAANTLAALFNIVLFRGVYPTSWSNNRTTLIPKQRKDQSRPENWRPITIAPVTARLFSGIVESRLLQQVTVSERQRGFRPGNGCHQNCWILDEVIRQGKKSSVVGLQLDVSKAFDTVSHAAIAEALLSHGVSPCLLQTVRLMYSNCSTTLGNLGTTVSINRGVKQGDPLSPLLFNLVLDPLLTRLQNSGEGFTIGDCRLAAMAYADDITLFSDTTEGMQTLLQTTEEYLASVGMSLSAAKCGGFNIMRRGDAWVVLPLCMTIQGQPITSFTASSTFTYLGLTFSIQRGFQNRQHLNVLSESATRVRRLALKPHQKVALLMQYIVPAFAHRLAIDTPSKNDLDRVDSQLRSEVKRILHLHPTTTDSLLYTRKKDGGLGFPHLVLQARLCGLRAASALLRMEDPLLQELGRVGGWTTYVEKLAQHLRVPYPTSPRDLARAKLNFKDGEFRRWSAQLAHGQGVSWFRDNPLGNFWLLNQQALRPGQFIDALKLRTNTFGTRSAISRGNRNVDTICRRCRLKPETLGHVIGECSAGWHARIERHNWIVRKIEEDCKRRGALVAREQEFEVDGERLKPDLVIVTQDRAVIVDVTLPYENQASLSEAALRKTTTYTPLLPTIQREFHTTSGEVIPVVIGARGAVPRFTITGLKKIGITERKTLLDFALTALRTSIDICRGHLNYRQLRQGP